MLGTQVESDIFMPATGYSRGKAERGVNYQELNREEAIGMNRDARMVTDDTDRSIDS